MGKKKIRKDRWDLRGNLKRNANRHNMVKAMHPQVRRQIEDRRENHDD